MTTKSPVTAEWIDALLQAPTRGERVSRLRSASLLNREGLSQLLDQAMHMARSNPGQARRFAILCAELANEADAPLIVPRSMYIRAQTHAANGEFDAALELIQSAFVEYESLGEQMEALRTNIGRMHVLNELGRHTEALAAGQLVLDTLAPVMEPSSQAQMLLALANQNRGVCFETMGRYEDALESYAHAEGYFQALNMTDRIGDLSNNRGIVLTYLGRVTEALEAFESAARIWEAEGLHLLQAQTLSNIGEAHLVLGNYTRSLQAYEQARRLFEPLEAVAHKRILLRKNADAYLALNLYPEALSAYREAEARLNDVGMADHRARALWGMGAALVAQSQFGEASTVLAEAASLFKAAGHTPMLCSVMLEQAALHDARGERASALEAAKQALALVEGDSWPVQKLYASLRVADLLLPDAAAAEPYLLKAERLAQDLNLPSVNYRVNSRLGHLRRLQGRDEEALQYLDLATLQIEQLRGDLAQDALRTSFLRDKTTAYEDLIELHLARADAGNVQQAFNVAERAKSRTLLDLLTGVVTPHRSGSDEPSVAAQLESLRADLSAAYNKMMEAGAEAQLAQMRERAVHLEQEISRVQLQAAHSSDQTAASDRFAQPLTFAEMQAHLSADQVLVAYHILGEEILVFLYCQRELRVFRNLSRVSVVQELVQRLNAQWDRFRAGPEFARRHIDVLEKSVQRVLAAMYTELVSALPLDRLLGPGVSLAIVPHGLLHHVPFQALFDGRTYLIDRCEIFYAPSATVLALCQQRFSSAPSRALIVGVTDVLIPAAVTEATNVAGNLAERGIETATLTNEASTLAAVQMRTLDCDLLHFACHGLFRADNPMFSALKLHDGWLTAADVMQLDLTDTLVTLSACESGRASVLEGDEVIGLPRAFLGAGASAIVVSLWVVQDETTCMLMTDWYQRLSEGLSRAAALRAAQQSLRQRYPHPYYWAPFILIGGR